MPGVMRRRTGATAGRRARRPARRPLGMVGSRVYVRGRKRGTMPEADRPLLGGLSISSHSGRCGTLLEVIARRGARQRRLTSAPVVWHPIDPCGRRSYGARTDLRNVHPPRPRTEHRCPPCRTERKHELSPRHRVRRNQTGRGATRAIGVHQRTIRAHGHRVAERLHVALALMRINEDDFPDGWPPVRAQSRVGGM